MDCSKEEKGTLTIECGSNPTRCISTTVHEVENNGLPNGNPGVSCAQAAINPAVVQPDQPIGAELLDSTSIRSPSTASSKLEDGMEKPNLECGPDGKANLDGDDHEIFASCHAGNLGMLSVGEDSEVQGTGAMESLSRSLQSNKASASSGTLAPDIVPLTGGSYLNGAEALHCVGEISLSDESCSSKTKKMGKKKHSVIIASSKHCGEATAHVEAFDLSSGALSPSPSCSGYPPPGREDEERNNSSAVEAKGMPGTGASDSEGDSDEDEEGDSEGSCPGENDDSNGNPRLESEVSVVDEGSLSAVSTAPASPSVPVSIPPGVPKQSTTPIGFGGMFTRTKSDDWDETAESNLEQHNYSRCLGEPSSSRGVGLPLVDFSEGQRYNLTRFSALDTVAPMTPDSEMSSSDGNSSGGSPSSPAQPAPHVDREIQSWLDSFTGMSHSRRLEALEGLIRNCNHSQICFLRETIEPHFQRDFVALLPKELALHVLSFLTPTDLLKAAQTSRYWRVLSEDNLLWKEKCRKVGIDDPKEILAGLQTRSRLVSMTPPSDDGDPQSPIQTPLYVSPLVNMAVVCPWKAAYLRQFRVENNWRTRPLQTAKVLRGHDDHVITCLQFCDNRIISGSDDSTLKVWSVPTGRCLMTLVGHTGGVWSCQMAGSVVVSGSTDRTLRVWNAETGECIHTLYGHASTVRCMCLHGKEVVSGSRDATLRVWNIETGQCQHLLVGHVAAVRCIQYNGVLVVSGAYDCTVKVWDVATEVCLHTLQGHSNRVYSLQFDGIHIVSGSLDTSIKVWDVKTGQCRHTLIGHQSLTSGMQLRNNILVSGNADSTVKVWDITSGQCLHTLSGPNKHQSAVTCLQFNGNFVISSSDDGTVKLWDARTGEFVRNLVMLESGGSGGVVWRIKASRTKLVCAVGSRNGTEETKLLVLDFDDYPELASR